MNIVPDRQHALRGWPDDVLAEANINPTTRLATDYLNHFNEVIMLIDMLDAMPECVEDVLAWRPKSYQQHFRDSGFAARDLAIEAYSDAPAAIRDRFEDTIAEIDACIAEIQSLLMKSEKPIVPTDLDSGLHNGIARARAIINGNLLDCDAASDSETADRVESSFVKGT
ncbi:MAG: hypothetical protein AAGF59_13090 [Pseudomonadota bacterium]